MENRPLLIHGHENRMVRRTIILRYIQKCFVLERQ